MLWRFRAAARRYLLGNARMVNTCGARRSVIRDGGYLRRGRLRLWAFITRSTPQRCGQVDPTPAPARCLHQHGGAFAFGGVRSYLVATEDLLRSRAGLHRSGMRSSDG